jgi:hypothetical protein
MKKFVRFSLVLIAIVVLAVLVLALIEPTDVIVTRSTVIKAPKEAVFEQIVKFRNWPNWSAWHRIDSTMQLTYSGTEGMPGSGYQWVGDEHMVGTGEFKNTGVNGTNMDYELHLVKPWKMDATGTFKVDDTANGFSKVTWSLKKHTSVPFNAMNIFVKMDKYIGGDFESGLDTMKWYVENQQANQIKEVNYPGRTFMGVRKTVGFGDIGKFCGETFGMLGKEAGGKINGPATGIFYTWDTAISMTSMMAAFPVSDTAALVKGASFYHITPARAYMSVQKGGYAQSKRLHNALGQYALAKGVKHMVVLEEYQTGPFQEPDSNKWVTNIYYIEQ